MSISDIINPWGALREARCTVACQQREIEALYIKLGEAETKELAKMREMSDEMQKGIEALKRAIESGELNVPGLRQQ